MIYPIIAYGDPVLKKKALEIEKKHPKLKELIEDMFETMYDAPGIGLAAIQIGESWRIVTMDIAKREGEPESAPRVFINPEIVW